MQDQDKEWGTEIAENRAEVASSDASRVLHG